MKLLILLAVLIPLTVTAIPINKEVTTFYWEHDGVNTNSYQVECNGAIVLDIPGNTAREAKIADTLAGEGDQTCRVFAVFNEANKAGSESVAFFIQSGKSYQSVGNLAAPSGFRVE